MMHRDMPMTALFDKALEAVERWPAHRQEEAANILLALDALGAGPYQASADELRAVDQALQEIKDGHRASPAAIDAALKSFGS